MRAGSGTAAEASRFVTAAQFIGMGVIWGASFLFMKVALDGVSFTQVAWVRSALGAITLAILVVVARRRLPREPIVWLHMTVLAILGCVIPYLAFAWAEQFVSSSLASIYNATTPIMTAIIATLAFRVERLGRSQIIGVLLGILGVLVVIGPWQAELTGDLWGQLACLLATLCYGVMFGYIRKFVSGRDIHATTIAFLNIGIAAVLLTIAAPFIAFQPVRLDIWIVGSLVLLGALGTGLAYTWSYNVVRAWGPTAASSVTYVTPVVGVVLGVLLLQETLTWNEPVGALLVVLGILFIQQRIKLPGDRRNPVQPAPAPPAIEVPEPEDRR